MPDRTRLHALRDVAAVVGVGETDYADDYARSRRGERAVYDSYGLAALAYSRALADSGLDHRDIDGLVVGPTIAYETTAEMLGLDVRWAGQADAAQSVLLALMAIGAGLAECIALVYGNAQRSDGVRYGGAGAMGGSEIRSYVYYAPWGMTSQGALYAMLARRYMELHGMTEAQLGHVAVSQRQFASMKPNAVMRSPISIDDYLAGRPIVEPLRVFDYCLINDGGVALIVTTAERAATVGNGSSAFIRAVGRSDQNRDATSLRPRLIDFYHRGHAEAAEQLWDMAGFGPEGIDSVQIYDSFSVHVPVALEGFGYCPAGCAGPFLESGAIGQGGRLPVNTSGGHLSDSYMQGWNHQIEAVRQVRGLAGERQVSDTRHVHFISDVAGKVVTIVYGAST